MIGSSSPDGILVIVFPLLAMVVCALGFYALGKWLRGRGHGEKLDAINAAINKIQRKSGTIMKPLAMRTTRMGRVFSRLPLLGSKRQRQQWDELEKQIQEKSDTDTKQ